MAGDSKRRVSLRVIGEQMSRLFDQNQPDHNHSNIPAGPAPALMNAHQHYSNSSQKYHVSSDQASSSSSSSASSSSSSSASTSSATNANSSSTQSPSTSVALNMSTPPSNTETPANQESSTGSIFGPKSHDPVQARDYPWAKFIVAELDSLHVGLISLFLTAVALLAHDFTIFFLPKSFDVPTAIVLLVSFIYFLAEIILSCISKQNYIFSFFFWMDLAGTLSMITDLMNLSSWFGTTNQEIAVNRAGQDQLARTASALRVARLSRIVRVVRLVRIVRLFKYFGAKDEITEARPSKIGFHLAQLMTQRCIVCILIMLVILPTLDAQPRDTGISKSMGMEDLEFLWPSLQSLNLTSYATATSLPTNASFILTNYISVRDKFLYYHPELVRYQFFDKNIRNVDISSYRSLELEMWITDNSLAIFSKKDDTTASSGMDLLLTIIIVVLILLVSVIIRYDVTSLVTAPIERMTSVIKKMASTICYLSAESEEDSTVENDDDYETKVIENLLQKMAGVFNVTPTNTKSNANRVTVSNLDGEAPIDALAASQGIEITSLEARQGEDYIRPEECPDLMSIESILRSEIVLPHFRLYLAASFSLESLLFWQEVERFRSSIEASTNRLYKTFIVTSAVNQVNISVTQVHAIEKQLTNPAARMFDDAQNEVLNLLKTNNYQQFLQSKFCISFLRDYVKKRNKAAGSQSRLSSGSLANAAGNSAPVVTREHSRSISLSQTNVVSNNNNNNQQGNSTEENSSVPPPRHGW